MDLQTVTTRMTRRFGPSVEPWCADLPELVGSLARRWSLTPGEPFPDGASAITIPCGRSVLKLTPDTDFAAEQLRSLELFAGTGRMVRVLDADPARGALLLEAVRPGTDCRRDQPTPAEFGELLCDLHGITPPPDPPRHLRDGLDFLPRYRRRLAEPLIAARLTEADLDAVEARCDELLRTQTTMVLLHGDLHMGNLLHGPADRPHVLIDPKVALGDPCFDAVDYLLDGAFRDGIAPRITEVARVTALDPDRLTAWSRAIAPLIALVHLGRGEHSQAIDTLLTHATHP